MSQRILSSHRYDGIRIESVRRRRRTHNNSKIKPNDDENSPSKISELNISNTPIWLASSQNINSTVSNDNNIFPNMDVSFQQNTTIPQQEISISNVGKSQSRMLISTANNSSSLKNHNKCKQVEHVNQYQNNRLWKHILLILYGVLGILLLTALILPSILVYILAPKFSQINFTESSTYTNHCASISSKSLWEMDTLTTITMKINTSKCNFQNTPVYFVTIGGTCWHFCLNGYGAIYLPTSQSFQIYTRFICGTWNATTLLTNAQSCGWDVNWMGFYY